MGVWTEVRGQLCKVGSLPVLPLDVGSGDGMASPVLTSPSVYFKSLLAVVCLTFPV